MNTIFKFLIIFGVMFSIVYFGGTILSIPPLMLVVGDSLLVFLVIGYQAIESIKKNSATEKEQLNK
ncbi:hypothetical protein [Vagococcus fluvialis]|uniref:hypothetical protein n=2 Tax=Vagococcus fluvialis TaxID=2738 RepID=UPI0037DCF5F1